MIDGLFLFSLCKYSVCGHSDLKPCIFCFSVYNGAMFRVATGIIITIGGLFFLVGGLLEQEGSAIVGAVAIVIGIAILMNKKEDEIEQIKNNTHKDHE